MLARLHAASSYAILRGKGVIMDKKKDWKIHLEDVLLKDYRDVKKGRILSFAGARMACLVRPSSSGSRVTAKSILMMTVPSFA